MRIYLAARYDRRNEMKSVAEVLEAAGHAVTSVWVYGLHDDLPDLVSAVEDLDGVAEADCVVSFTEEPLEHAPWAARGGRHVEFGLGVAMRKRLCIVGRRENIFHHLPQVEIYSTVCDLIEGLASAREVAS